MFDKPMFFNKENRKLVMCRSYGRTDNGNPLGGFWAIYDTKTCALLDYSQYRNDLVDKWGVRK